MLVTIDLPTAVEPQLQCCHMDDSEQCPSVAVWCTYGPGLFLDTYTYACDAHVVALTLDGGTVVPLDDGKSFPLDGG